MSRSRATALLAVLLGVVAVTLADVIPKLPGEFGPSASVETFEGIAGVLLPQIEWGPDFVTPMSDLPAPWVLPSGVGVTLTTGPDPARVFDFGAPPYYGGPEMWSWGLSLEGGDISHQTPLPSGTAFFAANNGWDPGSEPPAVVAFRFSTPVQMVGAYVEAMKWLEVGLDGVVTLEAFDALGNSLGLLSVTTDGVINTGEPPYSNGLDTWIGLGTLDGSASIFSVTLEGYNFVADDLRFAVPEPAAAAAGLLGLAFVLRRR